MADVRRWRKKPIVIEAMNWDGTPEVASDIIDWVLGEGGKAVEFGRPVCIAIRTLEGAMHALPGDYVIRGVKGEFYPCKPDIFGATYEEAD